MNRINKIVIIFVLIFISTNLATAIPIDKKETLGPYYGSHRYYIHLYNGDDIGFILINGNTVFQELGGYDSGWIDITNYLTNGNNNIELFEVNDILSGNNPWRYGFEIMQDYSSIIWRDSCGDINNGCYGNDQTQGLVYRDVLTFMIGTQYVDRLNPGNSLGIGQAITSEDGRFKLIMQGDGNLVLYDWSGNPLWGTGTNSNIVAQAIMQGDGNFVIYDQNGKPLWSTNTWGRNGAWLIVQNDANVVIYDSNNRPLWATNTHQ